MKREIEEVSKQLGIEGLAERAEDYMKVHREERGWHIVTYALLTAMFYLLWLPFMISTPDDTASFFYRYTLPIVVLIIVIECVALRNIAKANGKKDRICVNWCLTSSQEEMKGVITTVIITYAVMIGPTVYIVYLMARDIILMYSIFMIALTAATMAALITAYRLSSEKLKMWLIREGAIDTRKLMNFLQKKTGCPYNEKIDMIECKGLTLWAVTYKRFLLRKNQSSERTIIIINNISRENIDAAKMLVADIEEFSRSSNNQTSSSSAIGA